MNSYITNCPGSGRLGGIQNILIGQDRIRRGLEELCKALKHLRCENEYEAQIAVVNGIHYIKEGLNMIRTGLCELRIPLDSENLREFREGVRILCNVLKDLCSVLKDICCGRLAEAEKCLCHAIKCAGKGLCMIERGLGDMCRY